MTCLIDFQLQSIIFSQDVNQVRSWMYEIDWYKKPAKMDSIVIVRSKPRDSSAKYNLQISYWTNYDSSSHGVSYTTLPLIIYTQVSTLLPPFFMPPNRPSISRLRWAVSEWLMQLLVSHYTSTMQTGLKVT